jgi:hypothetical protein
MKGTQAATVKKRGPHRNITPMSKVESLRISARTVYSEAAIVRVWTPDEYVPRCGGVERREERTGN